MSGVRDPITVMGDNWHPMQTLRRIGPTEWHVFDHGRRIAVIREVEVGTHGVRLLRAETWDPDPSARGFIGLFEHLKVAAWGVWDEWLREAQRRRAVVGNAETAPASAP